MENAIGSGIASAQQARLIAAQVDQAKSAAELNEASAMKARAEAWQTANYAGPEADARTASARSAVDLNERRGQEINAAIRFIDEQIKTEGTKRVLHMSDAALNDAKQALVDLEAKHSQLGSLILYCVVMMNFLGLIIMYPPFTCAKKTYLSVNFFL